MPIVGKTTRKHYQDQQVSGKIFLFDFKNPDNGATELKITGDFDTSTFIPHGVSLHYDSKTGMQSTGCNMLF